jgi:Uma2 family endonuclease
MRSSAQLPILTVAEYLEGELHSQVKHEYLAGQVIATTGTTLRHSALIGNLAVTLRAHLRGGPCRVYFADIKVRVEAVDAFYYPDVVVTCEPYDPKRYVVAEPILIVEVLSHSTETIDRREKLAAYRRLETLREYLIVDQAQREVTVRRRDPQGRWWQDIYGPDGSIHLDSVDLDLPLSSIYEGA